MNDKRKDWGSGPWDGEPDRLEFDHAGFPCLLQRAASGAWCGYVAVPPGHPLHGLHWGDDAVNVTVHGGLTYAGACSGHICHVAKPGEPDDVWWFGFDCSHCTDYSPGYSWRFQRIASEIYRTVSYARSQTKSLAEQLARCAP